MIVLGGAEWYHVRRNGKGAIGMRVYHTLAPVFDERSRVLILGTMPSPKSREAQFYYAHPQNRFWPTMARLFDEPTPQTSDERHCFALRHGIALWDVLQSCEIEGASDASIRDAVPNELSIVLNNAPVRAVFTTGRRACALYNRLCLHKMTELECICLPSTSPANRRVSDAELQKAYSVIRNYLD